MFKMLNHPPNDGGTDEQPAEWVDAISACTYAMNRVEAEVRGEEEQRAEAEAKRKPRR